MAAILPVRADASRYVRTYSLEGVTFRVHFSWRPAAGAWYADIDDASGVRLLSGQRISPSAPLWPPNVAEGLPPGAVIVTGPDTYSREQFGSAVQLLYLTAAEVEAL